MLLLLIQSALHIRLSKAAFGPRSQISSFLRKLIPLKHLTYITDIIYKDLLFVSVLSEFSKAVVMSLNIDIKFVKKYINLIPR